MKLRSILVLAALAASSLILIATPAGADTNGVGDPLWDSGVKDSRGDINFVAATYTPEGIIGLGLAVASPESLSSFNWVNGSTAIIWDVATSIGTYKVFYRASGGTVYDPSFTKTCSYVPETIDPSGIYFAGFPASCLGSPSFFKIRGYLSYDDSLGGGVGDGYDFAPDSSTFCCDVTPAPDLPTTTTTRPTTPTTLTPTTSTSTTTPTLPLGDDPPFTGSGLRNGYWMATSSGEVYTFGETGYFGAGGPDTVDIEPSVTGQGYWLLSRNGEVRGKGDAAYFGAARLNAGESAVSLSALSSGRGYWIFTDKGRVLAFGVAPFFGDMAGRRLNGPILGSVATPSGGGYWMVGSDGGIFSFGDATFHGSTGNLRLNKPVMAMAPAANGSGYWLVASDGGIFAFDVPFYGSMGGTPLNKPISGMVPGSDGYMMVGQDGGIFSFGSVSFRGSLGATPPINPVVSVALRP